MGVWYTDMAVAQESSTGEPMAGVSDVHFDVTTDNNGQFSIDLSALGVTDVLAVNTQVIGQTLSSSDDINSKVRAEAVQISKSAIKGVAYSGNVISAVLGLVLKPLKRAGSGINIHVIATIKRG